MRGSRVSRSSTWLWETTAGDSVVVFYSAYLLWLM